MNENPRNTPVVLVILDGWGIAPPGEGNAIALAKTINIDKYFATFPHSQLIASGESVGLPKGEDGNTETGHLNIGAGKTVFQDLARINMAIAGGSFYENEVLLGAITHCRKYNSGLHLMGLIGAGGVHSNIEHLFALINLAKLNNFTKVFIHLFTDGRDSPPTSSATYVAKIRNSIKEHSLGTIASIMGRYWAMDRDHRWQRTAKAYFALTKGKANLVKTPEEAIETSYSQGKTDEFIEPSVVTDKNGVPVGLIKNNDAVVFFNFRTDRPRQLTKAFVSKDLAKSSLEWDFDPYAVKYEKKHISGKREASPVFERGEALSNLYFATMTEYGKPLVVAGAKVVFQKEHISQTLGQIISQNNLKQLRVSESEKEKFVTYYFSGQIEARLLGEDRIIIPSPKVPTYDTKPEMSAREITNKVVEILKAPKTYSFILVNFANADMVAHTGNIGSTVKACEVVDECIGKLANVVLAYGGTLLISADHGNAEEMINKSTSEIDTEHSTGMVPFIAISQKFRGKSVTLPSGILADIAPTVLSLLSIQKPENMTGRDLLKEIENIS